MNTKRRKLHAKSFNGLLIILITLVLSGLALAQTDYQITISTGNGPNTGTDADIFVNLQGTNGVETGWLALDKKSYNDFKAGSTRTFDLTSSKNLKGNIKVAFLVAPRKTAGESWFLSMFKLRVISGYSQISSDKSVKTWIHPGKPSQFYDSGLTISPVISQLNKSAEIILVSQPNGTFLIKVDGKTLTNLNSNDFVLNRQPDGTFLLDLQPNTKINSAPKVINNQLLADNRDDCAEISLRRVSNNSFQIINDCTGQPLTDDGNGNNPMNVIFRQTGNSSFTAPKKVLPGIIFENRTDNRVDIYSVDVRGMEIFYGSLEAGDTERVQKTSENQRWRIRRGSTFLGDYVATGNYTQTVYIRNEMTRTVRLDVQRQ